MKREPELVAFEEHIVSTMSERAREFCDFASSLIRDGGDTDLAQRCMAAAAACIEVKARSDYEKARMNRTSEQMIGVMENLGMVIPPLGFDKDDSFGENPNGGQDA